MSTIYNLTAIVLKVAQEEGYCVCVPELRVSKFDTQGHFTEINNLEELNTMVLDLFNIYKEEMNMELFKNLYVERIKRCVYQLLADDEENYFDDSVVQVFSLEITNQQVESKLQLKLTMTEV